MIGDIGDASIIVTGGGIVTGKGGTHGGTAAMTDVTHVAITAVPTATVTPTRATTVVAQESAFIWRSSCGDILNREEPRRPAVTPTTCH